MICERAGVSPRMFFNYAGTKDAAIVGSAISPLSVDDLAELRDGEGDLLAHVLSLLVRAIQSRGEREAEIGRMRREIIRTHPTLVEPVFGRMNEFKEEVREVAIQRLARQRGVKPSHPDVQTDATNADPRGDRIAPIRRSRTPHPKRPGPASRAPCRGPRIARSTHRPARRSVRFAMGIASSAVLGARCFRGEP